MATGQIDSPSGMLPLEIEPPIHMDKDGTARIAGTRVALDTVIIAYQRGASVEDIADSYPSVSKADIFSVLGYYLKNEPAVQSYLDQRQLAAKKLRQEIETQFSPTGLKDRLSKRRSRAK